MATNPITFILCVTYAEAEQLAAAAKLDNWRYLNSTNMLRGFSKPIVWRTPCWYYRHGENRRAHSIAMSEALKVCQAQIHRIGCLEHGRKAVTADDNS